MAPCSTSVISPSEVAGPLADVAAARFGDSGYASGRVCTNGSCGKFRIKEQSMCLREVWTEVSETAGDGLLLQIEDSLKLYNQSENRAVIAGRRQAIAENIQQHERMLVILRGLYNYLLDPANSSDEQQGEDEH